MRKLIMYGILLAITITGCNSVYISPNSQINKNTKIYVPRGGYTMARSIKQELEQRGHTVYVGKLFKEITTDDITSDDGGNNLEKVLVPNSVKYVVKVKERKEKFRPIWCVANGFWWWNFNVSITEQSTGHELMTWRGRGCANSSMRKLRAILNYMETDNETRRSKFHYGNHSLL